MISSLRDLATANYTVVQLDTSDKPDSRGIDVGMLTKLPLAGTPKAHAIDFGSATKECGKTTRHSGSAAPIA